MKKQLFFGFVPRQGDNLGFRASQKRQCKALFAGNGRPFSRTATPQWRFCEAPFGRGDKRPSALLCSLDKSAWSRFGMRSSLEEVKYRDGLQPLAMASPAVARLAASRFSPRCIPNYHLGGVLVLIASLIITGCARTPLSTFYTLSPMQLYSLNAAHETNNIGVLVERISMPESLDRPQIVTRSSANILAISEFHRWGGSFENDFRRVLGENLSILLNSNRILLAQPQQSFPVNYSVVVNVLRFDGKLGGEVFLNASWIVFSQRKDSFAVVKKSSIREQSGSDDFGGFVAAQSQAIETLSREIAEEIKRLSIHY